MQLMFQLLLDVGETDTKVRRVVARRMSEFPSLPPSRCVC